MDLLSIYDALTAEIGLITGKTYTLDYAPVRNYSEQSGFVRYVKPTRWSKERVNRGTPLSTVAVQVGIIGLMTSQADLHAIENEIDLLAHSLLRSDRLRAEHDLTVVAAQTDSAAEGLFSAAGLEGETQVLHAAITLTVRCTYIPAGRGN